MNKTLGIIIPYFMITAQCRDAFENLFNQVKQQLTEDMILYIYEDGQISDWLTKEKQDNIIIVSCNENKGVSYARNQGIDYLIDKVKYILFLDSDDRLDDDYLQTMLKHCKKNNYEIVESCFYVKDVKAEFNPNLVRCGVAGSAIQTKIIKEHRFDEKLQIGEDTKFMKEICDLSKYKKILANTNYYYQLGLNEFSLTMKYASKIISIYRN